MLFDLIIRYSIFLSLIINYPFFLDYETSVYIDSKDKFYAAKFAPTTRGGRKLVHMGYTYTINRKLNEHLSSWKCTKYKKHQCKARATVRQIKGEEYVKVQNRNRHSHPETDEMLEFLEKDDLHKSY